MSQDFHREDRYIVIKHKDLGNVPVAYRQHLVRPLFALQAHLPVRECVVVESDWPEYETVWRMIEARVTGMPQAAASPEVLAVVAQTDGIFPETEVVHRDAIDTVPAGTELIDFAHFTRLQAEVSALQQRLNVADQRNDELTTDRSPKDYAIEHAEYLAAAADSLQDAYKAYSLAQMNIDEGGDDGESELVELVDGARQDLHEALNELRGMTYEFRKRRDRAIPQ
jgi:hypothetical protein